MRAVKEECTRQQDSRAHASQDSQGGRKAVGAPLLTLRQQRERDVRLCRRLVARGQVDARAGGALRAQRRLEARDRLLAVLVEVVDLIGGDGDVMCGGDVVVM